MSLYDQYRCTLQLGGSDQWGNITAGIELIRRVRGGTAYGVSLPLVTKADGTKSGQPEGGTVWLDAQRTSPYEMYQFWLNASDDEVVAYLKYFTFLDRGAVGALERATTESPDRRDAQRALAHEVTRLVHGDAATVEAE